MICPHCGGEDVVLDQDYRYSDFQTWQTWRSVIPFTGLIAIGLKRLFADKVPVYRCRRCGAYRPVDKS